MELANLLFVFIIFSFIGWIIEFLYRGLYWKKIINPGFLTGPYLPIYGFGALIIYWITLYSNHLTFFGSIVMYAFSLSLLEFFTGFFFHKYFKVRLWDYSDKILNLKGYICLEFIIYWVLLSLAFKNRIFPYIYSILNESVFTKTNIFFIGFIYGIFIIDFINSIDLAYKSRSLIIQFNQKYLHKKVLNIEKLYNEVTQKLNNKVKDNEKLSSFKTKMLSISNYFRLRRDVKKTLKETLQEKIDHFNENLKKK